MFSLESPQRGDSNEYTQYTIFQYKKETIPKLSQICNYGICSKGLKNEFETAVVNEPSVFEPLKFYCMYSQFSPAEIYFMHFRTAVFPSFVIRFQVSMLLMEFAPSLLTLKTET